jgi:translation initiation factor IF-3
METKIRVRYNLMIRVPQVRVISSKGEQLGVLQTQQALRLAEEQGLDLIEIAPNAAPPVCKIMDLGKYKYQISKRTKEAKKKQHMVKVKEIKLRPQTDTHDYDYKLEHAKSFLKKGDRVKFTVVFRGREMAHLEFGNQLITRIKADLAEVATPEMGSRLEGKKMTIMFIPGSIKNKPKNEEPKVAEKPPAAPPAASPGEPAN